MTTVTITFDATNDESIQEAQAIFVRFIVPDSTTSATVKPETAAAKKRRLAAERKASEAEAETSDTDTDTDEGASEDVLDLETVRKALKDYAGLEGREAAIAILNDHNASSMSELDESEFASVIKAIG